jgi:hypothetical protein
MVEGISEHNVLNVTARWLTLLHIQYVLGSFGAQGPVIMTEVFCYFPRPLQINAAGC